MNIRKHMVKILSTFFYLGYLPILPGTFASIVAIFLFYLTKDSILIHALFTLLLIILGLLVTTEAEKIFNKKDARYIVIDEISGMLLAILFIPYDIRLIIIAFILFRILDALKPYPADRLQAMKGNIGVMGDDIVA